MSTSPPLLIDTTSLLRAGLDRFDDSYTISDNHSLTVIESLILFERILLDGPSIERNAEYLQWLVDIEDGIEILDISSDNQSALHESAAVLAHQIQPRGSIEDFMRMRMPPVLGYEALGHFAPSSYWSHLQYDLNSEDLRKLQRVFDSILGENVPSSGAAFVALARSLYYLCLQEKLGSSLLLDPLKGLETFQRNDPASQTRCILDLFERRVRDAYVERKTMWLGETPRSLRLPLLANFVTHEAKQRGWSIGKVILSMRQSREVELFRSGMN